MKVMRLLEEQGQSFTLADGKSLKAYIGEVLPGSFVGFAMEKAKAQKAGCRTLQSRQRWLLKGLNCSTKRKSTMTRKVG